MTKTSSKRFAAASAGLLLFLTCALPALAAEPENRMPVERPATFCNRIANLGTSLQTRLNDRREKIDDRHDERKTEVTKLRGDRAERHDTRSEMWDKNWNRLIGRLENAARTDAQKSAIAAFKRAMDAAWKVRDAAIEAATFVFRTGIDKAIADKKAAVEVATTSFKNSVKTAFDKAKADCASGVSPETVKTDLKTALDAAAAKLKTDRAAIEKIGANVSELAKARQVTIEKAKVDFKAAAEKARLDLKAAFKAAKDSASGTRETKE